MKKYKEYLKSFNVLKNIIFNAQCFVDDDKDIINLKELVEKEKPMKVSNIIHHNGWLEGTCNNCKESVYDLQNYCNKCGQKIYWS